MARPPSKILKKKRVPKPKDPKFCSLCGDALDSSPSKRPCSSLGQHEGKKP
jgi:hypothetical protein